MKTIIRLSVLFALCGAFAFTSCDKKEKNNNTGDGSYRENKEKSETYMANKAKEEGVRQSSTGLLFKVVSLDPNKERPELGDSVVAKIRCERFDGICFSDTTAKIFIDDQPKGLLEGLTYMTEGSEMELYVPYYLGFGEVSTKYFFNNKTITVLPYTALHYNVKLNKVYKKK